MKAINRTCRRLLSRQKDGNRSVANSFVQASRRRVRSHDCNGRRVVSSLSSTRRLRGSIYRLVGQSSSEDRQSGFFPSLLALCVLQVKHSAKVSFQSQTLSNLYFRLFTALLFFRQLVYLASHSDEQSLANSRLDQPCCVVLSDSKSTGELFFVELEFVEPIDRAFRSQTEGA